MTILDVNQEIRNLIWRGSESDFATDLCALFTKKQMERINQEIAWYLNGKNDSKFKNE